MDVELYIVIYDISSDPSLIESSEKDRRRKKIREIIVEDYNGKRLQDSVYECWLTNSDFIQMKSDLKDAKDVDDSVKIVYANNDCELDYDDL